MRQFEKYKNPIKNSWHQLIISHEGKYSQAEILDAFFDAIAPNDCMPCYYNPQERSDMFFVRDCYDALEALYYKKLIIPIAGNVKLHVTLKMSVAEIIDSHLDPIKIVHSIVNMNYDEANQILNLERFGENDLLENIICRISTPRTLTNILTYAARKYTTNIIELRLGLNGLKSARGMHPMLWMKGLKEVNLSNNKIEEVKLIEPMPKGTVTSLWLEGNPLCLKYTNANSYITVIKEILPNLEYLVSFLLFIFVLLGEPGLVITINNRMDMIHKNLQCPQPNKISYAHLMDTIWQSNLFNIISLVSIRLVGVE